MKLFGTSGIRRLFDADLVALALKTGMAVGKVYGGVVLGRDTRTSGPVLGHALISGLLSAGARCADSGILPTPTLAYAGRNFKTGVMVTASHNPPEYNGIKLWNPDGSAFSPAQEAEIEDLIMNSSNSCVSWDKLTTGNSYPSAIEEHTERILKDFPEPLHIKVVLDCDCAAASVITPHLLRRMGCEVVGLNCHPSGFFPHPIEPVEDNLQDAVKMTRELGAQVGIVHDGDADRMMAIDEKGRFIPGDKLMVLLAKSLGATKVITTVDASMTIEEMGFKVKRTRVGDTAVSDELKRGGEFGGEPSGAWIFPKVTLCPDGIYAAAQIAALASREKLSALVDAVPSYPLMRGSIKSDGVTMAKLESCLARLEPLDIMTLDGVKLMFKDGWMLVRPSGTEPKMRVTVEAKTENRAKELYDAGMGAIKACKESA